MKYLKFFAFALLAIMMPVACDQLEEAANDVDSRITALEERVTALEELCKEMNSNISSLQTIVTAMQTGDYITSVTPITADGKTVGYTITFAKGDPITIYHGQDGADGKDGVNGQDGANGADGHTPVIGVKQDTDGIWYWTVDGEWLLDANNQKVKAVGLDGKDGQNGADGKDGQNGQNGADGKDGVTPQLKIEDGYWYVSTDNGATWTQLGKATGENGQDGQNGQDGTNGVDGKDGDSMFQSVSVTETEVTFVTADGQTFVVKRAAALSIGFDSADLVVMAPNTTRSIHYTITSGLDDITIEALSSADIKVKVNKTDAKTGTITVKTSATIDEYSKVVVLVNNGSQAIMRTLNFEAEAIEVEENTTKEISDAGGEVTLEFFSNVPCHAVIPEDAQSWISVAPETKGLTKQNIGLIVQPNTGLSRSATIIVVGDDDASIIVLSYTISQEPNHDTQLTIERNALIAIYEALEGDDWTDGYNNNWLSDKPVGEWSGIGVDENGYVTYLYLTGTGEIPSAVQDLSHLKSLRINYYQGNVNREIPACILSLSQLEFLHLYGQHLIGTIPSEIGNLNMLKHLEISDTKVSGQIPESIGQLTQLEYLDFQWNQLSGVLPASMGNLTKLRHLMLRRNQFSGNIPEAIQSLPIWKYDWGRVISGNSFNEKTLVIPSPEISGTTTDGESISCPSERDDYSVLIQWSAQDDDYLVSHIESLNQILTKYKEKVSFVGLVSSSREQGLSSVKTYIQEHNILWPSIYWEEGTEVVAGQETALDGMSRHEYAAPCFPAIFVFHNGRVVYWDLDVYGGVSGLDDFLSINVLGEAPSYYVSTDYSNDGLVTTKKTASVGSGIDLILMGDAFSDRQIADGSYTGVLDKIVDSFFSEEPYSSYRDFFNVYYVNVVSVTEGYEHDGQALNTFFGSGTFVGGNNSKCIEYALKAISEDRMDDAIIIVAMNKDTYAGTCHMMTATSGNYGRGLSIAYFPTSSDIDTFNGLVSHEAGGHGFAKLADEYAYESMGAIPSSEIASAQQMATYGWWKNVDFTSNPAQVKWAQFIADDRYAGENIGCYEGAYTYWTGAWRPTENSIMRYNTGGFNAPSRYAIWYRIGKLAYGTNWEGSYEDFVAYDQVNLTPAAVQKRQAQIRKSRLSKPLPPLAPPVIVGHSWREELKNSR